MFVVITLISLVVGCSTMLVEKNGKIVKQKVGGAWGLRAIPCRFAGPNGTQITLTTGPAESAPMIGGNVKSGYVPFFASIIGNCKSLPIQVYFRGGFKSSGNICSFTKDTDFPNFIYTINFSAEMIKMLTNGEVVTLTVSSPGNKPVLKMTLYPSQ